MKAFLRIFLVIVALVAAAYFLLNTAAPEAVVEPVRRDLAVDAVSGNLRIFSAKNLLLKSEQDGRVAEVIAPPNSGPVPVKAGQVVVQLDTEDVLRDLNLARVRLETAVARQEAGSVHYADLGDAEADLVIQEELADNGQIADAELQKTRRLAKVMQIKQQIETAYQREEVAEMEAEVARLESTLKRLAIVSPFDGYVTDVYTLPGDLVSENAPVARVISDQSIVELSLSEEDFAGVKPGQNVTARLLSQGQQLFNGEVDILLAEADPNTRRRNLYVTLDAPSEALVPGTTGQASITRAQNENALVVPRRALLGRSVYVVDSGVVRLREVQTGFLGLNLAEITDGLSEGELVIVETPHLFRDGEEVSPVEDSH